MRCIPCVIIGMKGIQNFNQLEELKKCKFKNTKTETKKIIFWQKKCQFLITKYVNKMKNKNITD